MTSQNIGKIDRIARIIIGIILIGIGWGVLKNNWVGFILNMIAAYLLFTSIKGTCYIYAKFGKSTLKGQSPITPKQSPPTQAPPPIA